MLTTTTTATTMAFPKSEIRDPVITLWVRPGTRDTTLNVGPETREPGHLFYMGPKTRDPLH